MRRDKDRVLDILTATERIEKYAVRGKAVFLVDELIQTWIVHHLEIIGEAARSLSAEFREKYGDIPWPSIIGMRNILIHHYFGIDAEIVWSVVERELPVLKQKLNALIDQV